MVPERSALCVLCLKVSGSLSCPSPRAPRCTWLEVIWYMMTVLLHFVLIYSENTDGPKYYLRSNHLLSLSFFFNTPSLLFPRSLCLECLSQILCKFLHCWNEGCKRSIFSAAALAHVISAALWDWLWKDIKVNTLLSNAML